MARPAGPLLAYRPPGPHRLSLRLAPPHSVSPPGSRRGFGVGLPEGRSPAARESPGLPPARE